MFASGLWILAGPFMGEMCVVQARCSERLAVRICLSARKIFSFWVKPFRKNLHTFFDSYFIICKLSENIWKPDSQKTSERCNENICDRVKEILILGKGAFAENKKNFLAELLAGGLSMSSQPPARRRLAVFPNVTKKASIF